LGLDALEEVHSFVAAAQGRGYLGVEIEDVSADTVKELNLREERGVLIREVRENSPAAKAGLRPKDVVIGFNGQRVESLMQFTRMLRETPEGRPVSLSVLRSGREQEIQATLGSRKKEQWGVIDPQIHVEVPNFELDASKWPNSLWKYSTRGRLGIQIQSLTGQLAEYFGVEGKHGLLVSSVIADSPAAKAGIRAGDVIVAVEDRKIEDMNDLTGTLRGKEGDVNLTIVRDRQRQTVRVTLENTDSTRDRIERRKVVRPRTGVARLGPFIY
jgi:S1-C subfamily serine protease